MDEAILFLLRAIPYKYNLHPYYTLFHLLFNHMVNIRR